MRRLLVTALLLAALPPTLDAQGTLSGQGFGFPPGQLSTRSLATGGAFAEFDPQTPINPASLGGWGPTALFLQYEPEFRVTDLGDDEASSRLVRFPLVALGFSVGRLTFGLSTSTFLDRTSSTSIQTSTVIDGETIESIETFRSDGSINDVRFAAAYSSGDRFRAGLSVHALTGENRIFVGRVFLQPGFDSLSSRSDISYNGLAGSVGIEVRPLPSLALAASGRIGGDLTAYVDDEERSSATVPTRVGVGIGYGGIRGLSIAARYDWEEWSSLDGLGSDDVKVHDTRSVGVGVEVTGPSVLGANIPLRLGGRWRSLPFSSIDSQVDEAGIAGGFGIPLRFNRSAIDVAVQRVARSGDSIRERSWIASFAITVRP